MKERTPQSPRARQLKVCPSLSDEQFMVVIRQLSNSLVRGCVGSLFLDRGENFVQSRDYQQGDSTGLIDWKASARTHGLVVKEHESMRKTVVSLVVDRSGSMTAGSPESSKYAAACVLCGGLAHAALKIGSPVSFILSDAEAHPYPTLSSARVSSSLMSMRDFHFRERTPLTRCLTEGFRAAGRRQMIFVLSDFHDTAACTEIALLAQRHEVILIRLVDPVEVRTPGMATIRLAPAEGGPARYVRHQNVQRGSVDEALASLRLPTVTIDPSRPVSHQLGNFLAVHKLLS